MALEGEGPSVLQAPNRFTIGPPVANFNTEINRLLDSGAKQIIVDLRPMEKIDSSGLGALVRVWSIVDKRQDVQLLFVAPTAPDPVAAFANVRIGTILPLRASIEEAKTEMSRTPKPQAEL